MVKSFLTTTAIVSILSVSAFAGKKAEKMAAPMAPATMDSKMAAPVAPMAPAAMDSKMAAPVAPMAPAAK